jgi:hypothetical protein
MDQDYQITPILEVNCFMIELLDREGCPYNAEEEVKRGALQHYNFMVSLLIWASILHEALNFINGFHLS